MGDHTVCLTSAIPNSCSIISATRWRSTIRARSIRTAASITSIATTARSTMRGRATWSAARGSSSTMRWPIAGSANRPTCRRCGTAWHSCASAIGNRRPAATPGCWTDARIADATNHCYGLAFVLLAYAHAAMAGIDEARAWIGETFDLMEQRFWSPIGGTVCRRSQRRLVGAVAVSRAERQHAFLRGAAGGFRCHAASRATSSARPRSRTISRSVRRRSRDGLVWEHYHADWSVDWDYNKDDKTNIFRPWGYQPGHLTEWAKLLLILERHRG